MSVTYGGGTTCHLPEAVVASTTIEVACDESAQAPTGFTYTVEQCSLTVSLRSMYGCPSAYTTGLSGGWVFLLLLLISSLVYLVGGIAYKKATLGTSGTSTLTACVETMAVCPRCVAGVNSGPHAASLDAPMHLLGVCVGRDGEHPQHRLLARVRGQRGAGVPTLVGVCTLPAVVARRRRCVGRCAWLAPPSGRYHVCVSFRLTVV